MVYQVFGRVVASEGPKLFNKWLLIIRCALPVSFMTALLMYCLFTTEPIISMVCTIGIPEPISDVLNITKVLLSYFVTFPYDLSGHPFLAPRWCLEEHEDSRSHGVSQSLDINFSLRAVTHLIILVVAIICSTIAIFGHKFSAKFIRVKRVILVLVNGCLMVSVAAVFPIIGRTRPQSLIPEFPFCDAGENKVGECRTESAGNYALLYSSLVISAITACVAILMEANELIVVDRQPLSTRAAPPVASVTYVPNAVDDDDEHSLAAISETARNV